MKLQSSYQDRGHRAPAMMPVLSLVVFLTVMALAVGGFSSPAVASSNGPANLTNITVAETGSGATVVIESTKPVKYKTTTYKAPVRLIVDIPNAVFRDGRTKTIRNPNTRLIKYVKAGLFKTRPPVTRVVTLLSKDMPWSVNPSKDGTVLAIEIGALGRPAESKPAPAKPVASADVPPSLVVQEPEAAPKPSTDLSTEAPARAKVAKAQSASVGRPSAPETTASVTGVAVETGAKHFRLDVDFTGELQDYNTRRMINPFRYVVVLHGASLAPDCPNTVNGDGKLVESVTATQNQANGSVEVTLVLTRPASCSAFTLPGKNRIVAEVRERPTRLASAAPSEGGTVLTGTTGPKVAQRPRKAPSAAKGEELIDIDFYKADIVDVLSALAAYSDKNIVASPDVTGEVTVHLSQVTLEDALDLITRLYGYAYALRNNRTYIIAPPEKLAQFPELAVQKEKVEAEYIPPPLKYVSPEKVLEEFANATAYPNLGVRKTSKKTVLFTNAPEGPVREWIDRRLASLDVPENQADQLYELNFLLPSEAKALLANQVPDVQVITAENVQQVGPAMTYVAGKVITLKGFEDDIKRAADYLAMVDKNPAEVTPRPVVSTQPRIARVVYVDYAKPEVVKLRIMTQYTSQGVQVTIPGEKVALPMTPGAGAQGAGGTAPAGEGGAAAPAAAPALPYLPATTAPAAVGIPTKTGAKGGEAPEGAWLIVSGPKDVVDEVEAAIKKMDVPPKQVRIRTLVVDMVRSKDSTKGLQWTLPGVVLNESVAANGMSFGKYSRGAFDFSAILDLVQRDQNNKILARPTLIALHGKDATLLVGERIPYEISIPAAGTVTRSVAFEEVGVKLNFNATVASDNSVTLYIAPEVSSILGFTPQGYPDVSTRQASTYMRLHDGDSIVIGGLLQEEDLETMQGIPFLRKIPIFGKLFEHRRHTKRTTELVIIATIEVLDGQKQASTASSESLLNSQLSKTSESVKDTRAVSPRAPSEG